MEAGHRRCCRCRCPWLNCPVSHSPCAEACSAVCVAEFGSLFHVCISTSCCYVGEYACGHTCNQSAKAKAVQHTRRNLHCIASASVYTVLYTQLLQSNKRSDLPAVQIRCSSCLTPAMQLQLCTPIVSAILVRRSPAPLLSCRTPDRASCCLHPVRASLQHIRLSSSMSKVFVTGGLGYIGASSTAVAAVST